MLAANVYHDDDANRGVIEVLVPSIEKKRPNVQFVLTIDVSGSMEKPAVCKGEKGEDLNQGWSNLDINIHGILTLIGFLNEEDYLCMISFESNSKVILGWTNMNEQGKRSAEQAVRALKTGGMTNLASAIEKTGEIMLKSPLTKNVVSTCIIYTDGSPTVNVQRPGKYKQMLEKFKTETNEKKGVYYSFFSMAIGNSLDTELLTTISHVFHIPQTQFLCAFTVNLMAMILGVYFEENTIFSSTFLTVEGSVDFKKNEYVSCQTIAENQQRIDAGFLVCGINRNFVYDGSRVQYISVNGVEVAISRKNDKKKVDSEHSRLDAIEFIKKKNKMKIRDLSSSVEDDTLRETLEEVILGLESYHNTWGKHFVHSVSQALLQEVRTNYNDKVLQKYTSERFEEICDMGEDIFAKIKPPDPSLIDNMYITSYTPTNILTNISANPQVPTNRTVALPDEFMRGGGCFANLKQKLNVLDNHVPKSMTIENIIKNKHVKLLTTNGYSEIECIVSNETNANTVIVDVDGVQLTEWHPIILNNGEWIFARDVGKSIDFFPDYTFNFVMKNRSNLIVSGNTSIIEYATPGHAKTTKCLNSVSFHEYWATETYINDLKRNPSYIDGYVNILSKKMNVYNYRNQKINTVF